MSARLSTDFAALAIILGMLPLLILPTLLASAWVPWLLLSVGMAFCIPHRLSYFLIVVLLSFLWANFQAQHNVTLINRYADQSHWVVGRIETPNVGQSSEHRILIAVEQIAQQRFSPFERFKIAVSWSDRPVNVAAGQIWRMQLQLRAVHSRLNQGGFDSQRWALANHQLLTGKVQQAILVDERVSLRQSLIDRVLAKIHQHATADLLIGLAFGERSLLTAEHRQQLLHTGTAHLLAISGLHISLAALVGWWIARLTQFCLPTTWLGVRYPQLISWLVAMAYLWLSGANPPAMRAGLALTLWLLLRRRGYLWSAWQVWLYIVAGLLLYDPLMVLSDSFWLSCCAVAILIFWFQWVPLPSRFYLARWIVIRWLHLQGAITLLLFPLQIVIFNGVSWSSLIANLIAVPIVSLFSVPTILLALLASGWSDIAEVGWWLANFSLEIVLTALQPLSKGWLTLGSAWVGWSFFGWLVVVFWRLTLWRTHYILGVLLCCLAYGRWSRTSESQWRLDMLDVGHGLAIVVSQKDQAILYDTGQRWGDITIAEREIIPFLQWHGLNLSGIILSHEDSDHSGGLTVLRHYYPEAWVRSSSLAIDGQACRQGETWQWGQLTFSVLWPEQLSARAANRDSCVIVIDDGKHKILLTGDLEKIQELLLISHFNTLLSADILQVPHHGSNTSSHLSFLEKVRPQAGLVSVARYNPWRLPAHRVRQRYQQLAIPWYSTAMSGQVTIEFVEGTWQLLTYRDQIAPRWYHQWFGDKPDNR